MARAISAKLKWLRAGKKQRKAIKVRKVRKVSNSPTYNMVFEDFLLGISKIDVYLLIIVNGIFTGLGVSIGSYLANTHFIGGMQKLHKKVKRSKVNWWIAFLVYLCMFIALTLIIKFLIGKFS